MCRALCSLMEHQSLVDLAICCGNNTIHAHKCILAANSSYFRVSQPPENSSVNSASSQEQLERNSSAEQVIINGLDFVVMKSIVEFIYCGETNVSDENMKYMIAAAKAFQIRGLQALVTKGAEFSNCSSGKRSRIALLKVAASRGSFQGTKYTSRPRCSSAKSPSTRRRSGQSASSRTPTELARPPTTSSSGSSGGSTCDPRRRSHARKRPPPAARPSRLSRRSSPSNRRSVLLG